MSNVQLTNPAMPRLQAPLVDIVTGEITPPWHRLLIGLWQRLGGGQFGQGQSVYFQINQDGFVGVYRLDNNALIGLLVLEGSKGGPVEIQELTVSPFVFASTTTGVLTASSGKFELSRDDSHFYQLGLIGGAATILNGDFARISWQDQPPVVVFFVGAQQ